MTYKQLYEQQLEENNRLRLRITELKSFAITLDTSLEEKREMIDRLTDEKYSLIRDFKELTAEIDDLKFDIEWYKKHRG